VIRAATTLIIILLTAEFGSETVEVRDRGAVDLATFECRDTPRSTLIQRACYDRAQATLIVNVKGAYRQYCGLPAETFDRLMTAPSMGQFFRGNIEGAGSGGPYDCAAQQVPRLL
jgi:KTSC domain-containing protein